MKNTELALAIYQHYREINPQLRNYYGIVATFGLVRLAEIAGEDSEEMNLAKEILARFPDHVKHVEYKFPNYAIGGNAKARAVMDGWCPDRDQVREYAEEMMTAPRNAMGILSHPLYPERVWIDVAMVATPFLLYAGRIFGEQKYIDEAVKQTVMMHDLFYDPSCGLLHQSQGFCDGYSPAKISEDHWSRGNGWGLLPLAELIEHLPRDHAEYNRVVRYFIRHVEALLPYQTKNGMWRQEITLEEYHGLTSYEETTGTALILYSIGVGIRMGILDSAKYIPILRHGIAGLKKISIGENYTISNSCPGCLTPRDGSIYAYLTHKPTYVDEPHGAGPVIMALAEAHLCGIEE